MTRMTLSILLLFTGLSLTFSAIADAGPIDVSKESKRLAGRLKGARVYYSAFGGVDDRYSDARNINNPPLQTLLKESGAIIVPISEAKYTDIQIAYYRLYKTELWVSISRKNKVLFSHKYNLTGWFPDPGELENKLIRDLDSEEVL